MNERIRELLVEAGVYECDDFEPHPTFEKFAELIVRECRDVFIVDSVSWNLLNEKLEHFGVEK